MINELARSPTRSKNVYFANNEQVFATVFCFTHAVPAQAGNSVLCEIQRKQSNLLTFKNQPLNQR